MKINAERLPNWLSIVSFLVLLSVPVPGRTDSPAEEPPSRPSSAILFIGDGMGLTQVTAARIYKGNARDGLLTLDGFPHTALMRTYAADQMVTDSAASATAMATGFKTNNGMVGVTPEGAPLRTILERAKAAGKSVGIISTTRITHATPAAFYAHVLHRDLEEEIARQLVDDAEVDLILGGGRSLFLPSTEAEGENGDPGSRKDGRDLIGEARAKGYRILQRESEMSELATELEEGGEAGRVLGLFNPSHMAYEAERGSDAWGEPSLAEMTRLAINILGRNPRGYFLMVEGGRIDHACHSNQARLALEDLLAFDAAVAEGLSASRATDGPLVVVTADHETGGMALNGYTGIEISGESLLTTGLEAGEDILSFATGPGANPIPGEEFSRAALDHRQPALHARDSAAHTGVDVGVWAAGPQSELFEGTLDNTDVARIFLQLMGYE